MVPNTSVSAESSDRRRDESTGRRVELWHRPMRTGGNGEFDRVVAEIETLCARGAIDDFAVESWDPVADVTGRRRRDSAARRTAERYVRYRAFDSRDAFDGLSTDAVRAGVGRLGPEFVAHRVPRAVLFEYRNGTLLAVTPCDERVGALTERLREIAREERERSATRRETPPTAGRERSERERSRPARTERVREDPFRS